MLSNFLHLQIKRSPIFQSGVIRMTKLAELQILALDCQATGVNPDKGHLLEIGWVPACVSTPQTTTDVGLQSYLVRLPDQAARFYGFQDYQRLPCRRRHE